MNILKRLFGNRNPALNNPAISSSCGCVISWGFGFYDVKEGKDITHNVTDIFVDSVSSMVKVTIQRGKSVKKIEFTMEHAQEIGFINVKALSNYL
jgi:hypothetical protein